MKPPSGPARKVIPITPVAAAPGGSTAALLFLAALSLVAVAFCPFAAALALRVSSE